MSRIVVWFRSFVLRSIPALFGAIVLGSGLCAVAQDDGTLDTSFGAAGFTSFGFEDTRAVAYDIKRQSDGKLVLGGYTGTMGSSLRSSRRAESVQAKLALARVNSDGSLDTGFGTNGLSTVAFGEQDMAVIVSLGIMDDGRIQALGYIYEWGKGNYILLARFTSDGVLDSTYGENGIINYGLVAGCPFDSKANKAKIYSDGRVLMVGRGAPNGVYQGLIARFNSDGSFESTWGENSAGWSSLAIRDSEGNSLDAQFFCVHECADGKILCAGKVATMANVSGPADVLIARYTSAGVLDTTFGDGNGYVTHTISSGVSDAAYGINVDGAGNIYVAGQFDQDEGGILALDSSGALRDSFGTNGVAMLQNHGMTDEGMLVFVDIRDEGKVLTGGYNNSATDIHRYVLAQFTSNGVADSTFGEESGETLVALSALQDDDGQAVLLSDSEDCVYVAGGAANGRRFGVACFHCTAPTPQPIGGETVPVYRLYSYGSAESTYEHLWTTSETEKDTLDSWPSWQYEGIAWYAYTNQVTDAVPLYRLYASSVKQHHYTIDSSEYSSLDGNGTWTGEGIQYYVYATPVLSGAKPAYRFYHAGLALHHFTIDVDERDSIIANTNWGYTYEGVGYYVMSTNNSESVKSMPGMTVEISEEALLNMIPVSGDYDGDGVEDMAYYEELSGQWLIILYSHLDVRCSSSSPYSLQPAPRSSSVVGGPVVYSLPRDSSSPYGLEFTVYSLTWGGPGFLPDCMDFDGDGIDDLAVYHEETALWFVCTVDGEILLWEAGDFQAGVGVE